VVYLGLIRLIHGVLAMLEHMRPIDFRFKAMFSVDSAKAIKANKLGYLNAINYMAPYDSGSVGAKKRFSLCSHASAGCIALCLGKYSGQAAIVADLEHGTNPTRDSRVRKAQYFMYDRQLFMREIVAHIILLRRKAEKLGLILVIRMNGSTDIAHEFIKIRSYHNKTLPQLFPDIQFVDYTKNLKRLLNANRPDNYHLTFSLSEINITEARQALSSGYNVAVVFANELPDSYLGFDVIDGDEHDLRHLDDSPRIVGLTPKGNKAKLDASGFVVRDY